MHSHYGSNNYNSNSGGYQYGSPLLRGRGSAGSSRRYGTRGKAVDYRQYDGGEEDEGDGGDENEGQDESTEGDGQFDSGGYGSAGTADGGMGRLSSPAARGMITGRSHRGTPRSLGKAAAGSSGGGGRYGRSPMVASHLRFDNAAAAAGGGGSGPGSAGSSGPQFFAYDPRNGSYLHNGEGGGSSGGGLRSLAAANMHKRVRLSDYTAGGSGEEGDVSMLIDPATAAEFGLTPERASVIRDLEEVEEQQSGIAGSSDAGTGTGSEPELGARAGPMELADSGGIAMLAEEGRAHAAGAADSMRNYLQRYAHHPPIGGGSSGLARIAGRSSGADDDDEEEGAAAAGSPGAPGGGGGGGKGVATPFALRHYAASPSTKARLMAAAAGGGGGGAAVALPPVTFDRGGVMMGHGGVHAAAPVQLHPAQLQQQYAQQQAAMAAAAAAGSDEGGGSGRPVVNVGGLQGFSNMPGAFATPNVAAVLRQHALSSMLQQAQQQQQAAAAGAASTNAPAAGQQAPSTGTAQPAAPAAAPAGMGLDLSLLALLGGGRSGAAAQAAGQALALQQQLQQQVPGHTLLMHAAGGGGSGSSGIPPQSGGPLTHPLAAAFAPTLASLVGGMGGGKELRPGFAPELPPPAAGVPPALATGGAGGGAAGWPVLGTAPATVNIPLLNAVAVVSSGLSQLAGYNLFPSVTQQLQQALAQQQAQASAAAPSASSAAAAAGSEKVSTSAPHASVGADSQCPATASDEASAGGMPHPSPTAAAIAAGGGGAASAPIPGNLDQQQQHQQQLEANVRQLMQLLEMQALLGGVGGGGGVASLLAGNTQLLAQLLGTVQQPQQQQQQVASAAQSQQQLSQLGSSQASSSGAGEQTAPQPSPTGPPPTLELQGAAPAASAGASIPRGAPLLPFSSFGGGLQQPLPLSSVLSPLPGLGLTSLASVARPGLRSSAAASAGKEPDGAAGPSEQSETGLSPRFRAAHMMMASGATPTPMPSPPSAAAVAGAAAAPGVTSTGTTAMMAAQLNEDGDDETMGIQLPPSSSISLAAGGGTGGTHSTRYGSSGNTSASLDEVVVPETPITPAPHT